MDQQKKQYGKSWKNEDVDNVLAVNYYLKYFGANKDGQISLEQFKEVMNRDIKEMESKEDTKKPKGRKRDPGVAWILDVDNDGVVSYDENDSADALVQSEPKRTPQGKKEEL